MRLPLLLPAALLILVTLDLCADPSVRAGRDTTFSVRARTERPPEMGELHFLEISQGPDVYTVVPPSGWRLETDPGQRRLRFFSRESSAMLELRFHPTLTNTVLPPEELKRAVRASLPEVEILDEFTCITNDQQGPGIDFGFSLQRCAMRGRSAAIALEQGYVVLSLTCPQTEFAQAQHRFGGLSRSFQKRAPLSSTPRSL